MQNKVVSKLHVLALEIVFFFMRRCNGCAGTFRYAMPWFEMKSTRFRKPDKRWAA
jgi:hypothetical protein